MSKNHIVPLDSSTILGTSLTTNFQAFNASGFSHPCIMFKIVNTTTAQLLISFDGYYSHFFLDGGDEFGLNLQDKSSPSGYRSMFKKGTIVYVKAIVIPPKISGLVNFSGYGLVN